MYNVLLLAMICTFMELSSRLAKDTLVLNDIFAATILLRRALACQCHVLGTGNAPAKRGVGRALRQSPTEPGPLMR